MSQAPTRRESLVLSNSLGPTHGPQFQSADSTLTAAHPLLSPPLSNAPAQKYVPYVPRHRSPSTFTSTVNSSAASPSHQADGTTTATTSLQLMNLKAAAQSLGVEYGSVGWAMLEHLVTSDGDGDLDEVWSALTTGQVRSTQILIDPPDESDLRLRYSCPLNKHMQMSTLTRNYSRIISFSSMALPARLYLS
jgi:hypothetical protein